MLDGRTDGDYFYIPRGLSPRDNKSQRQAAMYDFIYFFLMQTIGLNKFLKRKLKKKKVFPFLNFNRSVWSHHLAVLS
jgi:hypothetical protein